jgi:hypothetical protein
MRVAVCTPHPASAPEKPRLREVRIDYNANHLNWRCWLRLSSQVIL